MTCKKELPEPRCGACPVQKAPERRCMSEKGRHPPDCPTVHRADLAESLMEQYLSDDLRHFAQIASRIERQGYGTATNGIRKAEWPRIVELVEFCRSMEYTKLGFIFCIGLRKEAATVNEILETNGFTVVSACCKAGGVPKSRLGLGEKDLLNPNRPESMCNPIFQSALMNEAKVEFNILFGLCVGHDTMALRALNAPATILAVKDRVLCHNPLGAIYAVDSYYGMLKKKLRPE